MNRFVPALTVAWWIFMTSPNGSVPAFPVSYGSRAECEAAKEASHAEAVRAGIVPHIPTGLPYMFCLSDGKSEAAKGP